MSNSLNTQFIQSLTPLKKRQLHLTSSSTTHNLSKVTVPSTAGRSNSKSDALTASQPRTLNKSILSTARGGLSVGSASQSKIKVLATHRKSSTTASQTRNNIIVGNNTSNLGGGTTVMKLTTGSLTERRIPKTRTSNSQSKLQPITSANHPSMIDRNS